MTGADDLMALVQDMPVLVSFAALYAEPFGSYCSGACGVGFCAWHVGGCAGHAVISLRGCFFAFATHSLYLWSGNG
jgi:hypothetical protein